MGIEELDKLTAEALKLGLWRETLQKWVEAERDKLRAQRETERAAKLKAEQQEQIAALVKAQLEDLRAAKLKAA